jgi:hypothetical protein
LSWGDEKDWFFEMATNTKERVLDIDRKCFCDKKARVQASHFKMTKHVSYRSEDV